ncbi:unnamed protein product [Brachionus calyciflorus]|uniref:Chitin-binding type-2 domain-containing protein n=1 Tax=Brachionus calyciflorus TaxID=104777 RepID=A0A814FLC9_9BILA|nr:unnamed protein product [Brachionus calyciflorus]
MNTQNFTLIKCAQCMNDILPIFDIYVEYNHHLYHKDCFNCFQCKNEFNFEVSQCLPIMGQTGKLYCTSLIDHFFCAVMSQRAPVYTTAGWNAPHICDEADYTNVPGTCDQFIRCSNGYLSILRCPYSTVWDSVSKTCSSPNKIKGPCGSMKQIKYQKNIQGYPLYTVHSDLI